MRRSVLSPLLAQIKGNKPDDAVAEGFVVAVLASISADAEASDTASQQMTAFVSEVHRRSEEVLASNQTDSQSDTTRSAMLKARLATLLDVAVRAGVALWPEAKEALLHLAIALQLDDEELRSKLDACAAPVLDVEAVAERNPSDWSIKVAESATDESRPELREMAAHKPFRVISCFVGAARDRSADQIFHADALRRVLGLTSCSTSSSKRPRLIAKARLRSASTHCLLIHSPP